MPISLVHRPQPQDVALAPVRFDAPGGTIGRCAGNTLVLPDPRARVARLQAVVRLNDGAASVQTLGSGCPVAVNGEPLAPGAQRGLRDGDELAVGAFVLAVRDETAAASPSADASVAVPLSRAPGVESPAPAPAVASTAGATAAGVAAAGAAEPAPEAKTEDVFADLFGPGTLPVGSAPDVSCHPFDMASAAARNSPDPLGLVSPASIAPARPADPLALFPGEPAGQAPNVFTDRTPTALGALHAGADPRDPIARDPIADALDRDAHGPAAPARDHAAQLGGHMRPASVARDPQAPRVPKAPAERKD